MKKSFTSTSTNSKESQQKPAYKQTILDDIANSKRNLNIDEFSAENLQRQTFLLRKETIDRIKDFVYTQKISGDILFTQKDLLEKALSEFFNGKQITKRPVDFKERRGRKSETP